MKNLSENTLAESLKEDEIYFERYLETRRLIMECDYNTLTEENYNRGSEERAMSIAEKMRAKGYSEQEIAELIN